MQARTFAETERHQQVYYIAILTDLVNLTANAVIDGKKATEHSTRLPSSAVGSLMIHLMWHGRLPERSSHWLSKCSSKLPAQHINTCTLDVCLVLGRLMHVLVSFVDQLPSLELIGLKAERPLTYWMWLAVARPWQEQIDLRDYWVVKVVKAGIGPEERQTFWPAVFTSKMIRASYINKGAASKVYDVQSGKYHYEVIFGTYEMHGTKSGRHTGCSVEEDMEQSGDAVADTDVYLGGMKSRKALQKQELAEKLCEEIRGRKYKATLILAPAQGLGVWKEEKENSFPGLTLRQFYISASKGTFSDRITILGTSIIDLLKYLVELPDQRRPPLS
ncbi:hypothetical protein BDR22DRAFT_894477 [Usnea florida]